MSAVQQLAIDAFQDPRAVVHGHRRKTLDAEIANAVTVLGSAGIDARLLKVTVIRGWAMGR